MARTRNRIRKFDELATPAGIREVLDELRRRQPDLIPKSDKHLLSLLNAVRHVHRYSATDVSSGRPSKWRRETLLSVSRSLQAILDRGTHNRVSVSSFIGVYLRVLDFPSDLISTLERGEVTLQEATVLARLSAERLATTPSRAQKIRREVLANPVRKNGSQRSLRDQVKEMLGQTAIVSSEAIATAVQIQDKLLEVDPRDKRHLFYETIKVIFYAFRKIEPEDIDDEELAALTEAADRLGSVLGNLRLRRQKKVEEQEIAEKSAKFYI
ncbi:MAG: hypothetical protein ACREDR_07085 [Blastocatellia bacterium]